MCLHDPLCLKGSAETRCNTHTHTHTPLRSSESAVSLAALWTHMSLPICLQHSVEINPWRHCVFNLRPEYHFLRLDVGGKVNVEATTNAYVFIMINPEENMNACDKLHGSAPSSFINQKKKKHLGNKKVGIHFSRIARGLGWTGSSSFLRMAARLACMLS